MVFQKGLIPWNKGNHYKHLYTKKQKEILLNNAIGT